MAAQLARLASRKRVTLEEKEQHQWVVDEATLSSVIANGEDVGPIIRPAFEMGKPEALLHQLRTFVKKKEVEIEELCKQHYEEFIHAVDELRYVLVDADELKHGLAMQNTEMQEVGSGLLHKLDELIQHNAIKTNLASALQLLKKCKTVVDLCAKVNEAIAADSYYQALKTLDAIERDHLRTIPSSALRAWVERGIPRCRAHIERKVNQEFNEWMVQIRETSQEIGRQAIGQAFSARQREVELGDRQRQAEEQTRSGARAVAYMLEVEDAEEDASMLKFNLTPIYRAHYINTCLGIQDQFRDYYYDNRKLQLNTDLQFTPGQSFNDYCSQVAGFFIVEDRIMRTAGGVIKPAQVDVLWETAIARMRSVMEEQFASMSSADHMLMVKEDISLFAAALRRYGFQVSPLLDVLASMRDKYHELLLEEARRQVNDSIANDKLEQMVMRKEYEYSMNVLAFHIQSTDIMPAFPWIAPFSASVPEICRIVRIFIDSSVSFLKHTGHMDQYDLVRRYLDRLLTTVVNEALLRLIGNPTLQVSHAMQVAANMTVMERACAFFAEHAAKSCGIPSRLVDGAHGTLAARNTLRQSQAGAYDAMLRIMNEKIDDMMSPAEQIPWNPMEPPGLVNEYLTDLCIYLETMMETARQLLPLDAFQRVSGGMMRHISNVLVSLLCGSAVPRFNLYAIQGVDNDLRVIEGFADQEDEKSGVMKDNGEAVPLKSHLAEARQLINLILSNNPEHYATKSHREKNYGALAPTKVLIVCDKYRDVGEAAVGLFGTRNSKQVNKKKGLDALARRLREDIANSA
ncbi:unnamed protein product [Closterium sp. Yama58-4]|nr:unnamed protein product [Closterium sp. Yama58-4]